MASAINLTPVNSVTTVFPTIAIAVTTAIAIAIAVATAIRVAIAIATAIPVADVYVIAGIPTVVSNTARTGLTAATSIALAVGVSIRSTIHIAIASAVGIGGGHSLGAIPQTVCWTTSSLARAVASSGIDGVLSLVVGVRRMAGVTAIWAPVPPALGSTRSSFHTASDSIAHVFARLIIGRLRDWNAFGADGRVDIQRRGRRS